MYNTTINEINQGSQLIHQSVVTMDRIIYSLAKTPDGLRLMVQADQDDFRLTLFDGERTTYGKETLVSASLTSENAAALRTQLPWLKPVSLGLKTSAGMGDRSGLATPGHVRAIRKMNGKIVQFLRNNPFGKIPVQVALLNR